MIESDANHDNWDADMSLSSAVDGENLMRDRIHTKTGSDPKESLLNRGFRSLRDEADPNDPATQPSPVKVTRIEDI